MNSLHSSPQRLDPLELPLAGSRLIEASAGTGKTFTIALLYVRLVLSASHNSSQDDSGAAPLLPPRILVVTFTEAATRELRDRIRGRLTQAAEVFSETAPASPPGADLEPLYRLRDQAYPDAALWPECRRRLLLAAEWMDEAAISTIHGWCQRMLGEHAFDSGSLFRLSLESDQSELLEDCVRDYWRTFLYPLPEAQLAVVLDLWPTPDALRHSLGALLGDAHRLAAAEAPGPLIARLEDERQARARALKDRPWNQWQPEVAALLEDLRQQRRLNGNSRNAMLKAWDALLAWADSEALLPDKLGSAGFKNQTPAGLARVVQGDDPRPEHPAFNAIAELLEFSTRSFSPRAGILQHAAPWVSQRLEAEKQQRAEMGFDDLLTRLDAALSGPRGEALATRLRHQFPVALIDEFQDTDPVQYRIFERIYRPADNDPQTGLVLIGDPKQAIYSFRGADIHTYLRARRAVAGRIHSLDRNFRSAQPLVTAVNRVFARADRQHPEGAFLFGAGAESPLPFQPVAAQGSERHWSIQGQPQASLNFWLLEGEGDKPAAKIRAREQMAESCATEIVRLLSLGQQSEAGFAASTGDLRPLRPQDLAILVNNRTEAGLIREALGRRRVKSVYLSDRESVLESAEAQEVFTWLRACAEPRNLALTRAALASPSLSLPWQTLDRLLSDELFLDATLERFLDYHRQWQTQGVLPMLRRFLLDQEVPARLLARADGERRLTNLLHLAELLQREAVTLDGELALVHHFAQLLSQAQGEEDERCLRLESDAGLVKVITVHKAKGLEYPLVFLPFATDFKPVPRKQDFLRLKDAQGQPQLCFEPDDQVLDRADEERLAEDIRKCYVALTRARHALWVGAMAIEDWHRSGLGQLLDPRGSSLPEALAALAKETPGIRVTPPPIAEDSLYSEPAPPALGPAREARRAPREDWWIASYSALTYGPLSDSGQTFGEEAQDAETQTLRESAAESAAAQDDPRPALAEPQPLPLEEAPRLSPHSFPRGALPGTFVHELLEWCARQGFAHVMAHPELLRQQLERRCQERHWSPWVDMLETWMLAILRTPLPLDPGGRERMALVDAHQVRPEMEFWFASRAVETRLLDQHIRRATLGGAARPPVEAIRLNGMLKGFIDLVFEYQGRYYVLDYKSNHLGEDDGAYPRENLARAILDKRYDLQYLLYLLALHRLLKARLPGYDYDRHLGGALYLFVRGIDAPGAGVFVDKPDRALMETLDRLFDGDTEAQPRDTGEEACP